MSILDTVASLAEGQDVHVHVDSAGLRRAVQTPDDVLFQIPLLALTMLVVARAKRDSLHTADMTTWACATLASHFRGVRDAHRRMDWSVALRRRCAGALVFLESLRLVTVIDEPRRQVKVTVSGLTFLRNALKDTSDLGLLVRALDRAYRSAESTGLELL